MNTDLAFRPARTEERGRILEIIAQAKAQMRALGSAQWQDGYPAAADIDADIAGGCGYVLARQPDAGEGSAGRIVAYGAVVCGAERAYASIEGRWLTSGNYVVLHRLAVADGEKRRGAATEFVRRTERLARERGFASLRIDTNFDNRYMLRLLARLGYGYCGRIRYASGERLAFEKRTS